VAFRLIVRPSLVESREVGFFKINVRKASPQFLQIRFHLGHDPVVLIAAVF
jgi:hypothetical protein